MSKIIYGSYDSKKVIDVLAFAPHPDDIEIFCGGTIAKMVKDGYNVAIVDLTAGELGTRGSTELREQEAYNASKILGIYYRENLGLPDGGITSSIEQTRVVVDVVRRIKPQVVLMPPKHDRHPDHGAAHLLIERALFMAALPKAADLSTLPAHRISRSMLYEMR